MANIIYGDAPVVHVWRNGDQAITASAMTTVLFNAVSTDTSSMYNSSNGYFTPKIAGWYSISACIYFTNVGAGYSVLKLAGQSNGASFDTYGSYLGGGVGVVSINSWSAIYMNGSTDYFYIIGAAANGGSFGSGIQHTWCRAIMVRSAL